MTPGIRECIEFECTAKMQKSWATFGPFRGITRRHAVFDNRLIHAHTDARCAHTHASELNVCVWLQF